MREHFLKGHFKQVTQLLEKNAAQLDDELKIAFVESLLEENELDRADQYLQDSLKVGPAPLGLWNAQALLWMRRGEWSRAGNLLTQLVQKVPQELVVQRNLGLVHLHAGDPQLAVQIFDKILVQVFDTETSIDKALAHLRLKNFDAAREALSEVFKRQADHPRAKAVEAEVSKQSDKA